MRFMKDNKRGSFHCSRGEFGYIKCADYFNASFIFLREFRTLSRGVLELIVVIAHEIKSLKKSLEYK